MLTEVHHLARAYHWPEAEILRLSLKRRLDYLMLIEADGDAELLAQLTQ
jgi:hypothetical protein